MNHEAAAARRWDWARATSGLLKLTALSVLAWMGWQLQAAPVRLFPDEVRITLARGDSQVLGRSELSADQADTSHLQVRRDDMGEWWLRNVSETREVEVRLAGQDLLLRTPELLGGTHLWIDSHRFEVLAAEHHLLRLRDSDGKEWQYDGSVLADATGAQQACPDDHLLQSLKRAWNTRVPRLIRVPQSLLLGGNVRCGNRLAIGGLVGAAVRIAEADAGGFTLRAASSRGVCVAKEPTECGPGNGLFDQELPMAEISRLVVGRTHFTVSAAREQLLLRGRHRVGLYSAALADSPGSGLSRHWLADSIWKWPMSFAPWVALVAFCGLLGALTLAIHGFGRLTAGPALRLSITMLLAASGLLAYLLGSSLGAGWQLALLFGVVVLHWGLQDHGVPRLSMDLAVFLLLVGLAGQLSLGLLATETQGLRYFQSATALASAGLAALTAWGSARRVRDWLAYAAEMVVPAVAVLAVLTLGLQATLGTESGVFGFQPLELGKFALIVMSAHVLSLRMEWIDHTGSFSALSLWWIHLAPLALLLVLILAALLAVNDYSPLILFSIWVWAMCLAWSVARGNVLAGSFLMLLAGAGGMFMALAQREGAELLSHFGFYGDRMAVWMEPNLHVHSGEQFRRAVVLANQAGLLGTDAPLGAWALPEVQNDMAPSFFLARFGAAGAVVLLCLQYAFFVSCLCTGWLALQAGNVRGNWRATRAGRFAFFSLWGGTALLCGHALIAWGCNLGFLPVMGQPMPFVAAAGSLWVFFIIPLLGIVTTAGLKESSS